MRHYPNLRHPVAISIERTSAAPRSASLFHRALFACVAGTICGIVYVIALWP